MLHDRVEVARRAVLGAVGVAARLGAQRGKTEIIHTRNVEATGGAEAIGRKLEEAEKAADESAAQKIRDSAALMKLEMDEWAKLKKLELDVQSYQEALRIKAVLNQMT